LDFSETNLGISNPVTVPFSAYKFKLINKVKISTITFIQKFYL